jgi:hypothetical protein
MVEKKWEKSRMYKALLHPEPVAKGPSRAALGLLFVAVLPILGGCTGSADHSPLPADTQPPTAPSNLTATANGASEIDLSWSASTDNVGVTGYRVERCQGAGCGNFAQIGTATGTTFRDTGLQPATAYSYRVRAADAAGNASPFSNGASATTQSSPPPPGAPTLVQHAAGSNARNFEPRNTYVLPLPNPSLAGNLIVVGVTTETGAAISVSDDAGNAYTELPAVSDMANAQMAQMFYAANVLAGAQAITVSFTSARIWCGVVASEFSGIALASPVDASAGAFAASGATSIAAGNMTTSVAGDLIWQFAMLDIDARPTWTAGPGATLLNADQADGQVSQYRVQSAAGPINPALTSSIPIGYVTVAAAFKAAAAGTPIPPGIHIDRVEHINTVNGTDPTVTFQFPSAGNLLAISYVGSDPYTIGGISDTNGNTWVEAGTGAANDSNVRIFYAANARSGSSLTVTCTMSGSHPGSNGSTFLLYDISGAAASPFDVAASATGTQPTSTAGDVTALSITPTRANGVILTTIGIAFDSITGVTSSPTGALHHTTTPTPNRNPSHTDENNGWAAYYNAETRQVTFTWQHDTQDFPGIERWASVAAAFKAP